MNQRIITISREWASGGHTIAELTAKKLGFPCYDTEIVRETAKKTGLPEDVIKEAEQKVTSSFLYNLVMGVNSERNYFEKIYTAERDIILEKAAEGPCVIVGRCADYIVKRELPSLRVFIYAHMNQRITHAVENYGVEESRAVSEIRRMDRERALHMKTFNDRVWGERGNYDLLLNAGFLGEDLCSDLIVQAYRKLEDIL